MTEKDRDALVDIWCHGFNCGANPDSEDDCDAIIQEAITKSIQSQPPAKSEPRGDALLPCPFCGGVAVRNDIPAEDGIENAGGSYIFCPACLANSALVFGNKSGLNEKWNRRAALLASSQGQVSKTSHDANLLSEVAVNYALGKGWLSDSNDGEAVAFRAALKPHPQPSQGQGDEVPGLKARIAELEKEIANPILCTVHRMADAIADAKAHPQPDGLREAIVDALKTLDSGMGMINKIMYSSATLRAALAQADREARG